MGKAIREILFDDCGYVLPGLVNYVLDRSEEYLNAVEKLADKPGGKDAPPGGPPALEEDARRPWNC